MKIEIVRNTDGGYVVNNQFFVPKDEENFDYQDIKTWVNAGNVIEPEFILAKDLEEIKKSALTSLGLKRDEYLSKLDIYSLRAIEGKFHLNCLGMDTVNNEYSLRLSEVITQKERLRKCTWDLRDLDVHSNEESVILQRIQELEILNFDPLKNLK
jgi:hypothetical protein